MNIEYPISNDVRYSILDIQPSSSPGRACDCVEVTYGTAPADGTPPSVTVSAPNDGVNWAAGSVQNIAWTATDNYGVTSVDLWYRLASQASWQTQTMPGQGGDNYKTVLDAPNVTILTSLLWFVQAQDATGNISESSSQSIEVRPNCKIID